MSDKIHFIFFENWRIVDKEIVVTILALNFVMSFSRTPRFSLLPFNTPATLEYGFYTFRAPP